MISEFEELSDPDPQWLSDHQQTDKAVPATRVDPNDVPTEPAIAHKHVLVVEDERAIRESLGDLLEEEGYQVSYAENGQDALRRLYAQSLPDIIIFDLRMPVMDGWEFRAVQKDDARLGAIPVVAISADGSAQAVAISAHAYLPKPLDIGRLLRTLERILFESERRRMAERLEEAERLASLGRLAAGIGHEINNPLTFSLLNLNESLDKLGAVARADEDRRINASLLEVTEMLDDCRVGLERIRDTVGNLQRLSRKRYQEAAQFDLHELIDQSVAMVWNQIRHRARLTRRFGDVPSLGGSAAALGQVFLNLLVNAAQAIPEGAADANEILILTTTRDGEVIVEISDTGNGISPEALPHLFEPFFTTKAVGDGTGLGLSISRQTVVDAGGDIEVESELGKGSTFRVILPTGEGHALLEPAVDPIADAEVVPGRARVLVIDDEPLVGRAFRAALAREHDVVVVDRASDALAKLAEGENFDLVVCDVVMPDISGPAVYALIAEKWPGVLPRLVFMTGGAFTPGTMAFMERNLTPVIRKPFDVGELRTFVRKYVRGRQ